MYAYRHALRLLTWASSFMGSTAGRQIAGPGLRGPGSEVQNTRLESGLLVAPPWAAWFALPGNTLGRQVPLEIMLVHVRFSFM